MNARHLSAFLILAAAILAAAPANSAVRVSLDGKTAEAWGEEIVVGRGEVYRHDIAIVGGSVKIHGRVEGDVVVVMGNLELAGEVRGDVVTVMTRTHLRPGASVQGDLVRVLGSVKRDGHVNIRGERVGITVPGTVHVQPTFPWLAVSFAMTIIGLIILVLIVGLMPGRVENMVRHMSAEPSRWLLAPLVGLALCIALPLVIIALVFSVVGIVLIPFLGVAYWLAGYFGIAAVYLVIGRRLLRNMRPGREPGILGPVVLAYLLVSIPALIPCVGFFICLILSWFGLGVALVTCFGRPGGWTGLGSPARRTPISTDPPVPQVEEGGEDEWEEEDLEEEEAEDEEPEDTGDDGTSARE